MIHLSQSELQTNWEDGFPAGGGKMARMTCRCGADLSNQEAPNDIELVVYTDKE